MKRYFRAAALLLVLGAWPLAWCAPPSEPDDLDREERLAAGKMAFRDNCLMCHSEEMAARLRLTEKQWMAEIDKMVGWGAPVPPDQKGPLFDYLVSAHSTAAPGKLPPPERMSLRQALALVRPEGRPPAGNPSRGAPLYVQHCATCHGPEARGGDLGTCLVEKTVLVRPSDYGEVVRKGRRRMPGFAAAIGPEQEADILAWLRTLRFDPPPP